MNIAQIIANEFSVGVKQVEAVFALLDEGNTIPFIARYRKEFHGGLDDEQIRDITERRQYLLNFEERRDVIINSITELEAMTPEIKKALEKATTLAELEDIYRPYKPKRKTRASVAKAKGLQPLADYILAQVETTPILEYAEDFIDEEKGVKDVEEALQGASDIIAEEIADEATYRSYLRKKMHNEGRIVTKKIGDDDKGIYQMYYEYSEPIRSIANHRLLAIRRAEKQKVLKVNIELPDDEVKRYISEQLITTDSPFKEQLDTIIADAYKRLMVGPTETEIRNDLFDEAEDQSMKVFQENLKQLLLVAPLKGKTVLGYDPAYRTGSKLALVDPTGKVLDISIIYPTQPHNKIIESERKLDQLYQKYHYDYIAIGNGTASRESAEFVTNFIEKTGYPIKSIIVNEAGASVYSASDLGRKEFPDFQVEERSAVSIARRLQDPLAELVKIDPKSIGVGQYQHDMNQKKLDERLGAVVETTVNNVGVDLNNASPSLLSYVSGISNALAESIVEYRDKNGAYTARGDLLDVPKLGPKTFEQCAGFLRIRDGHPLDNTGVHPESYDATLKLLEELDLSVEEIGSERMKAIFALTGENKKAQLADKLGIGVLTLQDIIEELEKPGRDPRDEAVSAELRHDITDIKDLKVGMVLSGTVRNIMDFGVFVDIGVHENGLVHISELANRYVKHPLEVVSVNQIVRVKVIGVDLGRKRISLSLKQV